MLGIAKSGAAILTAIHRIKANHGSQTAGVDGKTIRDILDKEPQMVIRTVQATLDDYRPQMVRRVWIPKPGKAEKRPLGIPAIADRVIQELLRMVMEPILEAQFFEHSYGFRTDRDAHQALERITDICHDTGYHWIVEGDIKGCFDNINHTKLIKQLWHLGIRDKRVLMIVKQMLKAGIMGEIAVNDLGTPQGGILSPLFANAYLHNLDQWITREWEHKCTKYQYSNQGNKLTALHKSSHLKPAYLIRYADDWVLVTATKAQADAWKRRIGKHLGTHLKLTLSEEKTLITDVRKKPIHFLGHEYRQVRSNKAKRGWKTQTRPDRKRLQAKVAEIRRAERELRKYSGQNLAYHIQLINSQIVGVGNFYCDATLVNPELSRHADSLKVTAYAALKRKGATWIPACEASNLIERHKSRQTKIPAVEIDRFKLGITSLDFVSWTKTRLKNQDETKYSPQGRALHRKRTGKVRRSSGTT
ncbi:MAG: group II intron reverse transcriptase/maturase [Firmicutes bacterium]|nr:group II intron reverse transcriptase/maturase [Bacillota bacterium]